METNETTLGNFLRRVRKGEENTLEIIRQALPDGKGEKTVVALQNRILQAEQPPAPQRAESPRRDHTFHDVEGFVRYLAKYKTEDTVILADVAERAIDAVVDEKAVEGFEVLHFTPVPHPMFAPWDEILGKPVPLDEFATFIMTNRRIICLPNGKELALLFSQVRASTNITVQRGRGNKSVNGVVIETEIQGERSSEPMDLPDCLTIETPIFVSGDSVSIEIDMLISVKEGNQIFIVATSAQVLEARTRAFEAMIERIGEIKGVTAALGYPAHEEWKYI